MSAKSDPIQGRRSTKSKTPNVVYASEIQEDEAVFGLFPRLAKGLKLAIILIVQIVCAFMISQYSISHTRKGEERMQRLLNASLSIYWNSPFHILGLSIPKSIENLSEVSIPNFIIDPSAFVFLNAIMLYGSAVLFFYNIGIDNQYQDVFLFLGALFGMLVGALASWSYWSMEVFTDCIPITITAALSLSLVWHSARPEITTKSENGVR